MGLKLFIALNLNSHCACSTSFQVVEELCINDLYPVSNVTSFILCSYVIMDTSLGFAYLGFSICHVLFDQSLNRL